jgi:hypothetical protein
MPWMPVAIAAECYINNRVGQPDNYSSSLRGRVCIVGPLDLLAWYVLF